jgi:hypothetical protein
MKRFIAPLAITALAFLYVVTMILAFTQALHSGQNIQLVSTLGAMLTLTLTLGFITSVAWIFKYDTERAMTEIFGHHNASLLVRKAS